MGVGYGLVYLLVLHLRQHGRLNLRGRLLHLRTLWPLLCEYGQFLFSAGEMTSMMCFMQPQNRTGLES